MGYQLFSESMSKKFVSNQMRFIANTIFVVKCFVAAAMKNDKYYIYIQLHQTNGEILYGINVHAKLWSWRL